MLSDVPTGSSRAALISFLLIRRFVRAIWRSCLLATHLPRPFSATARHFMSADFPAASLERLLYWRRSGFCHRGSRRHFTPFCYASQRPQDIRTPWFLLIFLLTDAHADTCRHTSSMPGALILHARQYHGFVLAISFITGFKVRHATHTNAFISGRHTCHGRTLAWTRERRAKFSSDSAPTHDFTLISVPLRIFLSLTSRHASPAASACDISYYAKALNYTRA